MFMNAKLAKGLRYVAFPLTVLLLLLAGFGCAREPLKLPQIDAGLAETVIVTRNGWDHDILPSSSAEVREFIGTELESCEPIKAYGSWEEISPDGIVYGSPNTVTLLYPNDSEIALQCFLLDGYIQIIDQTGIADEAQIYLVDDTWLSNFIETVTTMVEQSPDERYIENPPPSEYKFHVMTDDNAPIGCENEINIEGQMDALEMLAELENLKGFIFPADSGITLRFFFSQAPEDVHVRFIAEGHWQEEYPFENNRIKVPEEPGIYNIFVDIGWSSDYFETAYFSITVQEREDIMKKEPSSSSPSQATQPTIEADASTVFIELSVTTIKIGDLPRSIPYKIRNTSSKEIFGAVAAYEIEKYDGTNWIPFPFSETDQPNWPSAVWTLEPNTSIDESLYQWIFEDEITPGTYRIVKWVWGHEEGKPPIVLYAKFSVTGDAKPTYTVVADPQNYPATADSITVKITNTSGVEGGYGYSYRIERSANGVWETVPLDFDVMAIAAILLPRQTSTEKFSLHQEQHDYKPGNYRIVFQDGLGGASAEFALT